MKNTSSVQKQRQRNESSLSKKMGVSVFKKFLRLTIPKCIANAVKYNKGLLENFTTSNTPSVKNNISINKKIFTEGVFAIL